MREPTFKIGDLVRLAPQIDEDGNILTVLDTTRDPSHKGRFIHFVHSMPPVKSLPAALWTRTSWVSELCLTAVSSSPAPAATPPLAGTLTADTPPLSWLFLPDGAQRPRLNVLVRPRGQAMSSRGGGDESAVEGQRQGLCQGDGSPRGPRWSVVSRRPHLASGESGATPSKKRDSEARKAAPQRRRATKGRKLAARRGKGRHGQAAAKGTHGPVPRWRRQPPRGFQGVVRSLKGL